MGEEFHLVVEDMVFHPGEEFEGSQTERVEPVSVHRLDAPSVHLRVERVGVEDNRNRRERVLRDIFVVIVIVIVVCVGVPVRVAVVACLSAEEVDQRPEVTDASLVLRFVGRDRNELVVGPDVVVGHAVHIFVEENRLRVEDIDRGVDSLVAETLRGDDRSLDRPAVMAAPVPDLKLAHRSKIMMERVGRDLVRRLDRGERPSGRSGNQVRRIGQRTVFVADLGARRQ